MLAKAAKIIGFRNLLQFSIDEYLNEYFLTRSN